MTWFGVAHEDGLHRVYRTETGIDRAYVVDAAYAKPRKAIDHAARLNGETPRSAPDGSVTRSPAEHRTSGAVQDAPGTGVPRPAAATPPLDVAAGPSPARGGRVASGPLLRLRGGTGHLGRFRPPAKRQSGSHQGPLLRWKPEPRLSGTPVTGDHSPGL